MLTIISDHCVFLGATWPSSSFLFILQLVKNERHWGTSLDFDNSSIVFGDFVFRQAHWNLPSIFELSQQLTDWQHVSLFFCGLIIWKIKPLNQTAVSIWCWKGILSASIYSLGGIWCCWMKRKPCWTNLAPEGVPEVFASAREWQLDLRRARIGHTAATQQHRSSHIRRLSCPDIVPRSEGAWFLMNRNHKVLLGI